MKGDAALLQDVQQYGQPAAWMVECEVSDSYNGKLELKPRQSLAAGYVPQPGGQWRVDKLGNRVAFEREVSAATRTSRSDAP
jgi:hypothetical protein